MTFRVISLKQCSVNSRDFNHWIVFATDLNYSKKKKNKKIREYFTYLLGPEEVRWQLQGADPYHILKLRHQKDYTFLLLKLDRN